MAVTKLADSNDITSRALLMDGLLHQLGAPPSAQVLPHSVGATNSANHDKQESHADKDECSHTMM